MEKTRKRKKFPLHWRIIVFLLLGIIWGLYAGDNPSLRKFTVNYILPFGEIFLRLLKLVAIPIVLTSLITGIAKLRDASKLARIGGKTILLFLCTALIATSLGICLVNISDPGTKISESTRNQLLEKYQEKTTTAISNASSLEKSPLAPLVDMFPENIFAASSDNRLMIQVVIFALFFGIALTKVDEVKSNAVLGFLEGVNEVLMKMVNIIMKLAPVGVFALISGTIVEISGGGAVEVLLSLLNYSLTVFVGLIILLFIIYPLIFTSFSKIRYWKFFKEMRPAFLLGFTSSSSNATLPLTMERLEKHLNVPEEITGFVLPFGTTINMDGTALYQSIAAVFIAQAFGMDLSLLQMFVIVLTATVAAAGAAGIPGAGMITLIIVLETVHIPAAGIALIMAPDRLLDMCRTVVNVAGDAVAAVVIAGTEKPIPSEASSSNLQ